MLLICAQKKKKKEEKAKNKDKLNNPRYHSIVSWNEGLQFIFGLIIYFWENICGILFLFLYSDIMLNNKGKYKNFKK